MQIFVEVRPGTTLTLEADATDGIDDIKAKIQDRKGVNPRRQVLVFAGQVLDDGRTLSDYNIQKEGTLTLIVTPGIETYVRAQIEPPAGAGEQLCVLGTYGGIDQRIALAGPGQYAFSFFSVGSVSWMLTTATDATPDVRLAEGEANSVVMAQTSHVVQVPDGVTALRVTISGLAPAEPSSLVPANVLLAAADLISLQLTATPTPSTATTTEAGSAPAAAPRFTG